MRCVGYETQVTSGIDHDATQNPTNPINSTNPKNKDNGPYYETVATEIL